MKSLLRILLLLFVAAAGFILGRVSTFEAPPLGDAISKHYQLKDPASRCVIANADEGRIFELAAQVLEEESKGNNTGFLHIGAARMLGSGSYRRDGSLTYRVCPPRDIYERIFQAMDANPNVMAGVPEDWHLEFIGLLPRYNIRIAEQVARLAFAPPKQRSLADSLSVRDEPPLARSILAGMGPLAEPWRAQAFDQMSARDSLGTGAAQIAVATRFPDAIARVGLLIDNELRLVPAGAVIGWHEWRRLKELSLAISMGGDAARDHVAPLKAIMSHKIKVPAPPFGLLDLDPIDMCGIMRIIEGEGSRTAMEFDYCRNITK